MTLLDSRISLNFEKLFIPNMELEKCEIELHYQKKNFRLKYPLPEPFIMPLENAFKQDNRVKIFILNRESKTKLRKIAYGIINIYKKGFLAKNYNLDKWIYLDLNTKLIEEDENEHLTEIVSAMTSTGKVFMKLTLLNPPIEELKTKAAGALSVVSGKTGVSIYSTAIKNNIKNLEFTKTAVHSNKTDKFKSISENTNEFLRKLKFGKNAKMWENDIIDEEAKYEDEYDDDFSDVSVSDVEIAEDNQVEIIKLNEENEQMITQIKEIFESRPDELIPQDAQECKEFIKEITEQINEIQKNYSVNLTTLSEINKRLKYQAKNYFERYKDLKHQFRKDRDDYHSKLENLQTELKTNEIENEKIQKSYNDLKLEMMFFKKKTGIKVEAELTKDPEILNIIEILSTLRNESELYEGLTEEEKNDLINIFNKYDKNGNALDQKPTEEHVESPEIKQGESASNSEIEREQINKFILASIESFIKKNNLTIQINMNHIKEDKYDVGGKTLAIFMEGNNLKAFVNSKLIPFDDYLTTTYLDKGVKKVSTIGTSNTQSAGQKKSTANNYQSNNKKNLMSESIEKKPINTTAAKGINKK